MIGKGELTCHPAVSVRNFPQIANNLLATSVALSRAASACFRSCRFMPIYNQLAFLERSMHVVRAMMWFARFFSENASRARRLHYSSDDLKSTPLFQWHSPCRLDLA